MLLSVEPTFDRAKQEDLDGKGWWAGINTNEMARELKDRYMRWKYDIPFSECNQYVHPNPVVLSDYLTEDKTSMVKYNSPSTDNDLFPVASLASECMIDLIKNINDNIFS